VLARLRRRDQTVRYTLVQRSKGIIWELSSANPRPLGQGLVETDTGTFFSRGVAWGILAPEHAPMGGGIGPCRRPAAKPVNALNTGHSGALGGGGHTRACRAFLSLSPASKGPKGWGIWGGLVNKVGVSLSTNPCPYDGCCLKLTAASLAGSCQQATCIPGCTTSHCAMCLITFIG
jgi:hypothetical protein